MSSFAFSKALRLLAPSDFKPVFDQAPFRASHQSFLLLARSNTLGKPRLGLVIAKKNVRLAVQRNRIKRLLRDAFRLLQHELPAIDCVFIARRGLDQLNNESLRQQFTQQLQRVARKAAKVQDAQP